MKHLTKWNFPQNPPTVSPRLRGLGLAPLLEAILAVRGYDNAEDARAFLAGEEFCPASSVLHGCDKACARINLAVQNRETVAVFGDYDVDGITSTCLMADFLSRHLRLECIPYIPSRLTEGYGLNCEAISRLHARGVSLIITVDCGITATVEAEFAKTLGVDMIITDHHECQENLPDVCAIIDPKCPENCENGHGLAGVGVAFKLICELHGDSTAMLREYCDLVAIGTVADVMPLIGENRKLVREGLAQIATAPRAGILALLRETGADKSAVSASTIGFTLAPRLNAAGRLGCATRAAALLMESDEKRAAKFASELCQLNRQRQEMEREIWAQALVQLENHPDNVPIVLVSETWHQGVVGIVASRLAETYMLPTVMICLEGDKGKGSCRSCLGFNLFEALSACSSELEGFGGHALAAGLTVDKNSIDSFKDAFSNFYRSNLPTEEAALELDLQICEPEMLSLDCVRSLAQLEPCGNANPRPKLCIIGATLASVTAMGGGKHLRLTVKLAEKTLECVYFSKTLSELGLRAGDMVDLAFYPQINEYRSRTNVQLVIIDMRAHNALAQCFDILQCRLPQSLALSKVCPTRRDFAVLWRCLEGMGGAIHGDLSEILQSLAETQLAPCKLCACIAIFSEVGLLESRFIGDTIYIKQSTSSQKRDLTTSPYFAKLQGGIFDE